MSFDVYAAPSCDDNSFWKSEEFVSGSGGGTKPEALAYDIEKVSMSGDTFTIEGWAFNKGVNNYLNGGSGGGNSSVEFKLVADSGGKEYKFDVSYINSSRDLKYWNCYRTAYNASTSGGKCFANDTNEMKGGFSAKIDLSTIDEEGTYTLKMKWTGPGNPSYNTAKDGNGFIDVAISDFTPGVSEAKSYTGSGESSISISGFSKTAKVVASSARPVGRSGTFCDSFEGSSKSMTEKSHTYLTLGGTYNIGSQPLPQTRGGGANGNINLYPIQVNEDGTAGSAYTVYAPATWLQITGNVKIKIKPEEDEPEEEITPPKECKDEEIYTFHYFFLAELYPGTTYLPNTASSATWGDDYILKNIVKVTDRSELSDFTEGYVTITEAGVSGKYSLDWFYTNFRRASQGTGGVKYATDDNKEFYITYDKFTMTNAKGEIEERPAGLFAGATAEYEKSSVKASDVKITRSDGTGLGFNFDISRTFSTAKRLIKGGKAPVVTGKYDKLHHPAVYTMMFCKPKDPPDDPPKCDDEVTSAQCLPGDSGTHVVFHENKDIESCTLKPNTHSGFTIKNEEEDTTSPAGTEFGRVACKEDLDIYLPTTKQTASGQYFLLDKEVDFNNPHIKAVRTCATTEVKYSDLENDLKTNYEDPSKLELLYNTYRDNLYVHKNFPSGPTVVESTAYCYDFYGNAYPYTVKTWNIPTDGIAIGNTPNHKYGYAGRNGVYVPSPPSQCLYPPMQGEDPDVVYQAEAQAEKAKAEAAKQAYDALLKNYHETVLAYNQMFIWTDDVTNTVYHAESSLEKSAWIEVKKSPAEDTKYSFNPDVSFNYPDRDGQVFPVEYKYPVTAADPDEEKSYWSKGTKPNKEYTDPNGSKDIVDRKLTNCAAGGDTCEKDNVDGKFHQNGAMKRVETIEYDYNLPTVYTIVPHGRVTTSDPGSRAHLTLDAEAVPVNINTYAGTYQYEISIHKLKDKLRKEFYNKKGNNPDDNWAEEEPASEETRFIERKVLNSGQTYTCNYKVTNDIYIPVTPNEHFNFFYRIIDTMDINPNNRTLGYNWTDGKGDIVQQNMIKNEDYQRLTKADDVDRFVFTLTPSMMKQIRTYNATRSYNDGYADWDLTCNDYGSARGYHCYSNFLNCLTGGAGESGQLSCSSVLGDTFQTSLTTEFESKKSNYTYSDLDKNRKILINKQNSLSGGGAAGP